MKKILSLALVLGILSTLCVAFADEGETTQETYSSNVIIQREDIPLSEAILQPGFSLVNYAVSAAKNKVQTAASVYWKCWGKKGENKSTGLYYPIGYSQHISGETVLSTYHYTRTFLGSKKNPRGDSGYVWGTKTVEAKGTDCYNDVWLLYTQKVYYGTTGETGD